MRLRETRWTILLDGKPMTREALQAMVKGRGESLSPAQAMRWQRVWRHEFDVALELPKALALALLMDVRRVLPTGHLLRLEPVLCELKADEFVERMEP